MLSNYPPGTTAQHLINADREELESPCASCGEVEAAINALCCARCSLEQLTR